MRKDETGTVIFSPSDLVRYISSPFAAWMDRYHLEFPDQLIPDEPSAELRLIAESGLAHEKAVLEGMRADRVDLAEIDARDFDTAHRATLEAISTKRQVIYQAALMSDEFQGYADFVELHPDHGYLVWDTKLARAPKPYYIIQLCAYSEMLAAVTGEMPQRFGVILGTNERVEFRVDEFIHYYRRVKASMLAMQKSFSGRLEDRPEPQPRADHGRWTSHAERFFEDMDHLVRVAGISVGQIKKLRQAGIHTMKSLGQASGTAVPKLNRETLEKLVAQARMQCRTLEARMADPVCEPVYEVLPPLLANGRANGLTRLPKPHPADVFFDMEGYPLVPGGLEYLFGLVTRGDLDGDFEFHDWWAHDRDQEKAAFEGFVDFVYARWHANPGMHIYHYAAYEVSAVRRLSTRHETRQDEVDDLLRADVFVDLYQTVRQSLIIGEDSYSIKRVEQLYWRKRDTGVATAVDSIVQYAAWLASGEPADPVQSPVLAGIRAYNEDDCRSTGALYKWLHTLAEENGLGSATSQVDSQEPTEERSPNPEVVLRAEVAARLRQRGDSVTQTLADVLDYHRREDKPKWWRLFDLASAGDEELVDDPSCVAGIKATGQPEQVKRSMQQWYSFDPAQECKIGAGARVFFSHDLSVSLEVAEFDGRNGRLALKVGSQSLGRFGGAFPDTGSLLLNDVVDAAAMKGSLMTIGTRMVEGTELPPALHSLLLREPPPVTIRFDGESEVDAARRVSAALTGSCLVIQGPPGTGKTYTASRAIAALLVQGKRVGITSNSHKVVLNLMSECGTAARELGAELRGLKVGGDESDPFFAAEPGVRFVKGSGDAKDHYSGGVVGGTAWLFARSDWEDQLDFLFIDEAGQVPLANAVAVARCAMNLVLLGDQMQLEQPVQGTHPGDACMSVLQYALKDENASRPDAPVFHAVVPSEAGLFLGTSRRMHPDVCKFISDSVYEGRLQSHVDCGRQRIEVVNPEHVSVETGIVFSPVEHEGNVQRSDEEVERILKVLHELLGRPFTDKDGTTRALELGDFLFIAPYNAQVRALRDVLPEGARVGSVDKFQGQEAPVCVLSLCSSYGEYGSRGLGFILDKNRINVAVSRAKCLAVVVGDPRIADTLPASIDEMRLLSLFCRLPEQSTGG